MSKRMSKEAIAQAQYDAWIYAHTHGNTNYAGSALKNGDKFVDYSIEDGKVWFLVVDKDGLEYETDEQPQHPPLFTMTQFVGTWTEAEVKAHFAQQAVA